MTQSRTVFEPTIPLFSLTTVSKWELTALAIICFAVIPYILVSGNLGIESEAYFLIWMFSCLCVYMAHSVFHGLRLKRRNSTSLFVWKNRWVFHKRDGDFDIMKMEGLFSSLYDPDKQNWLQCSSWFGCVQSTEFVLVRADTRRTMFGEKPLTDEEIDSIKSSSFFESINFYPG